MLKHDTLKDNDDTPLHYDALKESVEMVKVLIAIGTDPNIKNNKHNTPLHYASHSNSSEMA